MDALFYKATVVVIAVKQHTKSKICMKTCAKTRIRDKNRLKDNKCYSVCSHMTMMSEKCRGYHVGGVTT